MYNKAIPVVMVLLIAGLLANNSAYAQELQISTFQEIAQVLVDKAISGNVTASVTLQTTSNQEIKVPSDLNQDILDNPRIVSVILTNQEGCGVLGVSDQSCILVNIVRDPEDTNIILIQEAAKRYGDKVIDKLNTLFDTDAKYHSSYLHHKDEINRMLQTSGAVSGRDIISAIYTTSKEDTHSMYQKISALTVDKSIRDSGGFYEMANGLSTHQNANMAFSIIPIQNNALYQLRVSVGYADAQDIDRFQPLDYLQVKEINRSEYFADGFYPLNSIFQIIVLSPQRIQLQDINADIIPTTVIDGEVIPTYLEHSGWVFDKTNGTTIDGKYLFGTKTSASSDELTMTLGVFDSSSSSQTPPPPVYEFESTVVIVVIIVIFGTAAVGFYLKGYRKAGA